MSLSVRDVGSARRSWRAPSLSHTYLRFFSASRSSFSGDVASVSPGRLHCDGHGGCATVVVCRVVPRVVTDRRPCRWIAPRRRRWGVVCVSTRWTTTITLSASRTTRVAGVLPTLLNWQNSTELFQDLSGAREKFSRTCSEPANIWIWRKTTFSFNIQSVVHCRKFSMKQNVNVSSSEFRWTYLRNRLLYFPFEPLEKCMTYKNIFQDFPGPKFLEFCGSWNFQEKSQDFLGLYRRRGNPGVVYTVHLTRSSKWQLGDTEHLVSCIIDRSHQFKSLIA